MTFEDARHLVSRTGLGTPPKEIERLSKMSRARAVDTLLAEVRSKPSTAVPKWAHEAPAPAEVMMAAMGGMSDRNDFRKLMRERGVELKTWWFDEMVATPSPLTERMTLFWHNHFTSSVKKVKRAELMFRQNQTQREHATGSFKTLLGEMLRDPAMLIYLDNIRNNANTPNENLGRELLELFTLGEGNYTEADVKAAGRALTGRGVNRRNGEFRDAKWKHDDSEKTILGETGPFDGDELVALLVENPACAAFIVTKLRNEFITTPMSTAERKRLEGVFRKSWRIDHVLSSVLKSNEFWSAANRGTRIKSPVEMLVGTVRTLELELDKPRMLVVISRSLGQDVLDPPNVKGWQGGEAWISSNTLLRRRTALSRAGRLPTKVTDLDAWFGGVLPNANVAERFERLLLAVPPVVATRGKDVRKHVQALLTDPAYQVG